MTDVLRVGVPVATVWTSPDSPRATSTPRPWPTAPDVDGLAGRPDRRGPSRPARPHPHPAARRRAGAGRGAPGRLGPRRRAVAARARPQRLPRLGAGAHLREAARRRPRPPAGRRAGRPHRRRGLRRAVRRPHLPLGRHQPRRLRLLGPRALQLSPGRRRGPARLPRPGPRGHAPSRSARRSPATSTSSPTRTAAIYHVGFVTRRRPDAARARVRRQPAGSSTRSSPTSAGGTWSPSAGSRSR